MTQGRAKKLVRNSTLAGDAMDASLATGSRARLMDIGQDRPISRGMKARVDPTTGTLRVMAAQDQDEQPGFQSVTAQAA